jgi:hypothetical protein
MDITYKKMNNSQLFENFKNPELLNMESCQNYIPLYNNFFKLNNTNYNNINLNNQNSLFSINEKISENRYKGVINTENETSITQDVFFKFSPLLDPYKYLAGKYDISDNKIFILPQLENNNCYDKVCDPNNSAYVDSFFTYLTSQLLNRKDFIHGLDFYGSFLGVKNEYHIDIGDDLDMLANSEHFHNNKHLYKFVNSDHEDIFNDQSRSNKKTISLGNDVEDISILNLENLTSLENVDYDLNNSNDNDISDTNLLYNNIRNSKSNKTDQSSDSDVSSRSSNTDKSHDNDSNSGDNNTDDTSDGSTSSGDSEPDAIMVSLKKFPVQIISLECCENTFDDLLANDELNDEELTCAILQILMMLITYQNIFSLTHNDLHTNNIMYVKTEKRYLYYKYNDKHYKLPTFGKIFKIIDFGRAIYKYKGKLICSDSFHKDGDAATQYNFEPYYNDKKPLVEPNMSFDLCRLGCSIYDFIIDEYDSPNSKMRPIHKLIVDWCVDDQGRNILYKNNDEERYPDFKLYKMIARKVHNHTPHNVIQNKIFSKYVVPKREIKKGSKIMNIDTFELN